MWKERVKGTIYSLTKQKFPGRGCFIDKKGLSVEEIKSTLNKEDKINLIVSIGTFESGTKELPKGYDLHQGFQRFIIKMKCTCW